MEAATLIDSPIHEGQIDISMRDYADDVSQALPLPDGNPLRAARRAKLYSSILSDQLEEIGGFTQNVDKEIVLPVVVGPGGYTATRAVLSGLVEFPRQVKTETVYLGGLEHLTGGAGAEIRLR
eukprot:3661545-Pyramimonas_sp.AAC.1